MDRLVNAWLGSKRVIAAGMPTRLALLLVVFAVVALFYSLIIPLFEGPDEDDHFRYTKYLADHLTLPVQAFVPGGGEAGHQGWQPPLYYSLAAILIAPIDTSDYAQQLWRNPASTFVGDPACCGRNLYYHPDSQNLPYTQTTLAVHLVRLLSLLFGAVTVGATYWLTRSVLAVDHSYRNPDLFALAAAAVVAFNPGFLFSSVLVSNDALLIALCTLVLLIWVRLLTAGLAPTLQSAALMGALTGLALLTKTTALGLIPVSVLLIVVVGWRNRNWNFAIIGNAVMLVVSLLVSGGWFVRNWATYGDPLAYRLMTVSALFPRAGPLTPDELFQISLPWMWQTFWGGPTPGDFSSALLILLAALSTLAFVGMVVRGFRIRLLQSQMPLLFLAAWLILILAAQVQFIRTTTGADQGRYLFPAISAVGLFIVLGLGEMANRLARMVRLPALNVPAIVERTIIILFFALAVYVPFAYTLPAYARPALLTQGDVARITHPTVVTFADRVQLLGYDLDAHSVKPGESLDIALYWRALAPMDESYRVFVHLIGIQDRSAGGVDVIPARGAFPTVYWRPGDAVRDVVRVPVNGNAAPGVYSIEIGLYPLGKPGERLVVTPSGEDRVILAGIKVALREPLALNPGRRVGANFEDKIELAGYDVTLKQDTLQLSLYWRARVALHEEYKVFVHALGADGKIVTQVDRQPQDGNLPTSYWDAGDQIRDDYILNVGTDPRAVRRLVVGLYRASTNERLAFRTADMEGDQVELTLPGVAP